MKFKFLLIAASVVMLLTSCLSYQKLHYVNEGDPGDYQYNRKPKLIEPFDELYIKVLSTDEKTAAIFANESRGSNQTDLQLSSYTVNEAGAIRFPFVGNIPVKDLTLEEAGEKIQKAVSQYLLNTAVRVRFINNNVTVLGAVTREGTFNFVTDKLSVFQAIGLAGGITPYGNRKKVTIIRTIDSKVTYNEINLADRNIVESKFYYIEPNDVVVVRPLRAITHTFRNNTYSTALTTISSLLAVLVFVKTY